MTRLDQLYECRYASPAQEEVIYPDTRVNEKYSLFNNNLSDKDSITSAETSAAEVSINGIAIQDWIIGTTKSHISNAAEKEQLESDTQVTLPEMIFGSNELMLFHQTSGMCLSFNAKDALKGTLFKAQDKEPIQLKVVLNSTSSKTSSARPKQEDHVDDDEEEEEVKELKLLWDWTYTTNYSGTLERYQDTAGGPLSHHRWKLVSERSPRIELTEDRIDFQKLKIQEPILWFDELNLYEDELHDHGVSSCCVKIRVMPSGFFCLVQFWMRLDHVAIRLYETRYHHVFGSKVVLKQFTQHANSFEQIFQAGHSKSMLHYIRPREIPQGALVLEASSYEKIYL